jgi:hypothetical protein
MNNFSIAERKNIFNRLPERRTIEYEEDMPGANRQGGAIVDGIITEFKTLNYCATPNTIKNDINKSIKSKGRAKRIIIDVRNTGLSKNEAEQGVFKALGISRGKLDYIEVIGADYFLVYSPQDRQGEK